MPEGVAAIAELEPEVGVLADFGRIVPPAVLDGVPRGILNVHPSLLPRHRGAAPVAGAILAGDTTTGVTIIRMDAGVDTGPIVASAAWSLRGDETAPELEQRAGERGAALLAAVLGPWLAGEIEPAAQDETSATLTRPFRREDGRLDPHASAVELERRVRALQPWPGTWLDTTSGRLAVWRAHAAKGPAAGSDETGTLGSRGLRASDGYLELQEVQPAGGQRMGYDAFLRGRPGVIGSRVITPQRAS
jgi:methionyl-tRNA formyltransferase